MTNNYLCLDLETGGVDESVNPIVDIGISIIDGKTLEVLDEVQWLVKPYMEGAEYTQRAYDVHGISKDDLIKKGISSKKVIREIVDLCKKYKSRSKGNRGLPIIVAHNTRFERRFLEVFFALHDKDLYDHVQNYMDDTMFLYSAKYPNAPSVSLGNACEAVGIELTNAHRALPDAKATSLLFRLLIADLRKDSDIKIVQKSSSSRGTFKFQIQQ